MYKLDNPVGIPSNAITLEEFYTLHGVSSCVSGAGIDRYGGANQTRLSEKQRKKCNEEINVQMNKYFDKREQVRRDYYLLIETGEIRDKTPIEKTLTIANQNPDCHSTQAARRMAFKRGYDWRTGKKINEKRECV